LFYFSFGSDGTVLSLEKHIDPTKFRPVRRSKFCAGCWSLTKSERAAKSMKINQKKIKINKMAIPE